MQYKLKLNCPKYQAGEMFHISHKGNLVHTETGKLAYTKKDLKEYPSILKDWFEEIPEKPKTVWDLKEGDRCYRAWLDGNYIRIVSEAWEDTLEQRLAREYNNIFLTLDDTQRSIKCNRAQVILQRDMKGFKPDWSDVNQYKYFVCYDYTYMALIAGRARSAAEGHIYFATKQDALDSIKAHPNECKTFLGVEE